MWLVDVENAFEQTCAWIDEAGVTRPVLMDIEGTDYESDSGLPADASSCPLHGVVDGDGIIRCLSRENHPDKVRKAIRAALGSL